MIRAERIVFNNKKTSEDALQYIPTYTQHSFLYIYIFASFIIILIFYCSVSMEQLEKRYILFGCVGTMRALVNDYTLFWLMHACIAHARPGLAEWNTKSIHSQIGETRCIIRRIVELALLAPFFMFRPPLLFACESCSLTYANNRWMSD